ADGGPLLLGQQVEAEAPPALDQLVGEGALLDADADQLRLEADLRRPVERHPVAPLPVPGPDDIEPVRHLPQHPPPQLVVLLLLLVGVDAVRERPDGRSGLRRHARTLPPVGAISSTPRSGPDRAGGGRCRPPAATRW